MISLQSKGLSRVFFSTAIQKHLSLLYGPALTSVHYYCLTFKKTKDRIRSNMLTNSNKHFKKWPIQKNLKKSIFTILCNYSCYLIPDRFQKPHKETLYLLACTSHSTTPLHASVSTSGTLLYFLSLGFFCSGNFVQTDSYIMQISFMQRIFKLHLPCSLYYYFTPFYGLRILRCLDRTPFVYLFIIYS